MKVSEIRQKSNQELNTMLEELFKEQFNLTMQKGTGQLAKPDKIKKVRRDIARIHTIINETASAS